MKAYIKQEEMKSKLEEVHYERAIYQAWMTANLTRAGKFPNFNELMNKGENPKEQSAEQMFAMVQLMNAALGGD